MPVTKHPIQTGSNNPAKKAVHQTPTGQLEIDPVRKQSCVANRFELVPVNPSRERAADLLILKEPVPAVAGMQRDPHERPHLQFHERAPLDSALFPDHADRRKRGR